MTTTAVEKKTKVRLGLLIQEDTSHNSYAIRVDVVTIGPTRSDPEVAADTVLGARDFGLFKGLYFKDLEARAYGYVPDGGATEERPRSIHWSEPLAYAPFRANAREVKAMARTFAVIEKRMAKLNSEWGYPATFGQYLVKLAKAIGADSFVFRGRHGDGYRFTVPGEGVSTVDHIERQWVKTGRTLLQAERERAA